jgi:hypothetical protein
MRKYVYFVWSLVILFAGCSLRSSSAAESAASAEFHRLVDSGDLDETYIATTTDFRKNESQQSWGCLLSSLRSRIGDCGSTTLLGSVYSDTTSGAFARSSYLRRCQKGDLREDFDWQIVDGKALLYRYSPKVSPEYGQ